MVLSNSEIFIQIYKKFMNRIGNLNVYKDLFSSEFYLNIDSTFFDRIKNIIVFKSTSVQFNFNILLRSSSKFYNVFINPYFYTYYNQNSLSRVSRVLNSAAKTEIKKLKLIRS